jgi:hypothetical protein
LGELAKAKNTRLELISFRQKSQQAAARGAYMNAKWNAEWLSRFGLVSLSALTVALLMVAWGKKTHAQDHIPVHITTDWSNRHMIYSAPSSARDGLILQTEPRYQHQVLRRNAPATQAQSGH